MFYCSVSYEIFIYFERIFCGNGGRIWKSYVESFDVVGYGVGGVYVVVRVRVWVRVMYDVFVLFFCDSVGNELFV